jgi:hypothetical protein
MASLPTLAAAHICATHTFVTVDNFVTPWLASGAVRKHITGCVHKQSVVCHVVLHL